MWSQGWWDHWGIAALELTLGGVGLGANQLGISNEVA